MLIAPGIVSKSFKFGEHVGTIYVSNDSSLDGVTQVIVKHFNQDPLHYTATLQDGVYVISEKRFNFPKSLDEWKSEHENFIFGECSREVRDRFSNHLIPDLEYFDNNGRLHFCFPKNYLKAKKTPNVSRVFTANPGSFYVCGQKSGFIPSGINYITTSQLEELRDTINLRDPKIIELFKSEGFVDDVDLYEMPYDLYMKLQHPEKKRKKSKEGKKSNQELKILAEQTKRNTEVAINELRNELRKSSGRVVQGDYSITDNFRKDYDLHQKPIMEEEDSMSSDTVSSE